MANHGPLYGLSRELQEKNDARFDTSEAIHILQWIELCTKFPMKSPIAQCVTPSDIADTLRNGVQLCALAERLLGCNEIQYKKNPKLPFHMMENIAKFLAAIHQYGVPEISLFQTVDLYEEKQLYKVFECLRSLGSVILKKHDSRIPTPRFAVKMNDENPRHFPAELLNKSQSIIALQYGTNACASQSGMRPYGLQRQILPDGK